jgi:putative membrane protein
MTPTPGWADDAPRTAPPPPRILPDPAIGPALLPPEAGGLIRHQGPESLDAPGLTKAPAGWLASFGLLGASVAVLVLGSFGLGLGLMLDDLFAVSPVLGWAGVAVGAGAGALLLRALGREWLSLRRLDALDRLALLLRETPDAAAPPAAILRWAADLARRLPEAAPAVAEMHRVSTMGELRGLFATALAPVLDAEVKRLGWQSAKQVFLTTAILPSPALDAAAMALLGLRLMRQVAVLHGLRPGAAVLWRLLRRLALSAGLTAGADLVAEAGVEQFLEGHAARLAGGAAGATVAARRMLRLAPATAACCRPFGGARR